MVSDRGRQFTVATLKGRNNSGSSVVVFSSICLINYVLTLASLFENVFQLLRKRHIGNDIVTIVFQEPGALPFTPKNIRSHFQHVFVIVRAHNPCSENTSYR